MHFIFRWLSGNAMSPKKGQETTTPHSSDFILVIGVSRPKLAVIFISVMFISLFLTFHILYDSAVISLQVKLSIFSGFKMSSNFTFNKFQSQNFETHSKMAILANDGVPSSEDKQSNQQSEYNQQQVYHQQRQHNSLLSHPNRVHFPKTSRRLPQVFRTNCQ